MSKVAPSQRIREEITRLLEEGLDGEADVTSTLLRLGAQRLARNCSKRTSPTSSAGSGTSGTGVTSSIAGIATGTSRGGWQLAHSRLAQKTFARRSSPGGGGTWVPLIPGSQQTPVPACTQHGIVKRMLLHSPLFSLSPVAPSLGPADAGSGCAVSRAKDRWTAVPNRGSLRIPDRCRKAG